MLIMSSKRSQVLTAGADGHKLLTQGVVDLLRMDSAAQPAEQQTYEVTSFCTLDNVTDFKLDPPKGSREQAALISVIGVIEAASDDAETPVKGFIVENIELLSSEQAIAFKTIFMKRIYYAALGGQISRKRALEAGSPDHHIGEGRPCKRLGRSPTGPELPAYSPSKRASD